MPVGTNVLAASYGFSTGDVLFDPVLRIDDATLELHTAVVTFNRYFGLFGTTARVDFVLPFQSGLWEGLLDGAPASREIDGLADPILRFSVNLLGAPALQGKEFLEHRKAHPTTTAVGAALAVRFPLGQYDSDRLINLGQNRFAFEPQLGVVHTRGLWSYELTGSAFLYTENDDFFGGNQLEQDPLLAVQAHVVRSFESRSWVSVGAAYGWNGESEINGESKEDERSNLLYGLAGGMPIGERQGVRLTYIRGDALEDIGTDSHSIALGWSIRF